MNQKNEQPFELDSATKSWSAPVVTILEIKKTLNNPSGTGPDFTHIST